MLVPATMSTPTAGGARRKNGEPGAMIGLSAAV